LLCSRLCKPCRWAAVAYQCAPWAWAAGDGAAAQASTCGLMASPCRIDLRSCRPWSPGSRPHPHELGVWLELLMTAVAATSSLLRSGLLPDRGLALQLLQKLGRRPGLLDELGRTAQTIAGSGACWLRPCATCCRARAGHGGGCASGGTDQQPTSGPRWVCALGAAAAKATGGKGRKALAQLRQLPFAGYSGPRPMRFNRPAAPTTPRPSTGVAHRVKQFDAWRIWGPAHQPSVSWCVDVVWAEAPPIALDGEGVCHAGWPVLLMAPGQCE